jgi:hypothetical protein
MVIEWSAFPDEYTRSREEAGAGSGARLRETFDHSESRSGRREHDHKRRADKLERWLHLAPHARRSVASVRKEL